MDYLAFIVKMQSIAKIGLKFSNDPYAIENYQEIQNISKKMLEEYSNETINHDNYFVKDIYPTPNVSVRVLVEHDDKILFVREIIEQKYSLPGGWCDIFKSLSVNACDEVLQESGYEIEINRVLAIVNKDKYRKTKSSVSEYCIYFSGKIIGGQARVSHETDDIIFCKANELPELSLKNSQHELDLVIDIYYNGKNTYFD